MMDSQARLVLAHIDPNEERAGVPIGRRDRALIALRCAGLSSREISELRGNDLSLSGGLLALHLSRYATPCRLGLKAEEHREVVAYLQATGAWGSSSRLFGLAPASVRGTLKRRYAAALRNENRNELRNEGFQRRTL